MKLLCTNAILQHVFTFLDAIASLALLVRNTCYLCDQELSYGFSATEREELTGPKFVPPQASYRIVFLVYF